MTRRASDAVLQQIVSTVASSLELDEVLRAVVRLLSEASAVHGCFVYLLDESGDRLVLKAASDPYDSFVDSISLERGRGLAWWAAEHKEPVFIADHLLDDPRGEYVPELDEERFQSLLSVPIVSRDGDVIGVISAHTEAPREFTKGEVEFVVTTASLVAGAIENARLYQDMRTRVRELEGLGALADVLAQAETIEELAPAVVMNAVELLRASSCHLYLLDAGAEELVLQASAPPGSDARPRLALGELGSSLAGRRKSRLEVPLVASDELLGLLVAEGSSALTLAQAVASQTAVAAKKMQLIDRLTERNLIADFFEELAAGVSLGSMEGRAARVGCDLSRAHVILCAQPGDDVLERALASALPGSIFHRRDDMLRALVPATPADPARPVEAVRRVHEELGSSVAIGISGLCIGPASFSAGFEEARQAMLAARVLGRQPSVAAFESLGAYKYLLPIAADGGIRDPTIDAVSRIADYDHRRGSSLLSTLEEFLKRRGNISAAAESLIVHQNTLRQRLRRIGEISGLDLGKDDWLTIEIAVKLVVLRRALGTAGSDTPAP